MGIKARLSYRLKSLVAKPVEKTTVLSARERAMLIPEVLEIILLLLPMQDLLVNVQRVNRHFHKIITSSWLIQQALFFRPIQDDFSGNVQTNPLLETRFRPWFEDTWLRPHGVRPSARFSARLSARLSDYNHFQKLDWNCSYRKTKAYSRKDASWRRMLVAQPPVQTLIVKMKKERGEGPTQFRGKLKFEHGLRMGLFYDLVEDFIEHQHAGYFVIRWHIQTMLENFGGHVAECNAYGKSRYIAVHLCQIFQGRPGISRMIGPEFRSRGYRPIHIDYCPEPRTEGYLFGYTQQDYEGQYDHVNRLTAT